MKKNLAITFAGVTLIASLLQAQDKPGGETVGNKTPANETNVSKPAGSTTTVEFQRPAMTWHQAPESKGVLRDTFRGSTASAVPGRFLKLFVPQPMPKPPDTESQFERKAKTQPWSKISDPTVSPGGRGFVDPLRHEPDTELLTVCW